VVAREYVPDAGDLIWLDFTPQAGREQAGRRPAVVLSRRSYNEKTCLAVVFRSEPPCEVAHPRRDSLRPFEKPRLAPAASPKGQTNPAIDSRASARSCDRLAGNFLINVIRMP